MTGLGDPLDLGEEQIGRIKHNSQVPALGDEAVYFHFLYVCTYESQSTISGIKAKSSFTPLIGYVL